MKITEPKTPYAKHYDPAEDPSDDEAPPSGSAGARTRAEDDIPGLSLGEPEEELPQEASHDKTVHVAEEAASHSAEDDDLVGLSPEEREKHRKFEEARKRHYEMKNVAQLLGNPEALPDDEDDGDEPAVPPVPRVPNGQ